MMKSKKAELTTKQIISIIILIISFSIIIAFLFMLNLREVISQETCRNSVILRSTVPFGKDVISLKCKTQDVCFSKNEECKESTKDTLTIDVDDKDELLDKMTDLMYDCYWQMGSGEVDFLPRNWGRTKNYCAICNRMYFDEGIKQDKEMSLVPAKDIFLTLKSKKSPDGEYSMLYDMYKVNSLDSITLANKDDIFNLNYDFSIDNGYLVITSMMKKGAMPYLAAGGGVVVGTLLAVFIPGVGWVAGAAIVVTAATLSGGVGFFIDGPGGNPYMPPAIYVNEEKIIEDEFNCKDFATLG